MQSTLARNKEISDIARKHVVMTLREVLSDPDFGLKLRPEVIRRLKKSLHSKESGKYRNLTDIE